VNNVPRQSGSMQGTQPPTFRPTVWPADPPRPPRVIRLRLAPVTGTGALELEEFLGDYELPPDFVFQELLGCNPTPDQAQEITVKWGLAGDRGANSFVYLPEHPGGPARELAEWEMATGHQTLIHPQVVILHLKVLRALSQHLLAYLENRGDDALVNAWHEVDGTGTLDALGAWALWERHMNAGLAAFAVHVRSAEGREPLGIRRQGLYNACCLQLAHYLASETPVMRCANERCHKPFTRQRGRARDEYGQHRSRGVRFCSHLCAKAQSERDRRRRRAQERKSS
jgi:hypothetical protein